MPPTETPATNSDDLVADVVRLPVRPGGAIRLLWMLDDSGASAAELGHLIESDPALCARVVRLANADFYGLTGEVTSAWRAVTVLGLATLRAVATAAAFDLFAEPGRALPAGYWEHALTAAAAASTIARRVGVLPNDAFSLGLLHDLGTALVCRRAPREYDGLVERGELLAMHPKVGASALSVMRFPADMVEAVAEHHAAPGLVPSLLGRLLVAADAVALDVAADAAEPHPPVDAAVEALGLWPTEAETIVSEVRVVRPGLLSFVV
jgi:putative nucleotidyltransferase with HDIG domain